MKTITIRHVGLTVIILTILTIYGRSFAGMVPTDHGRRGGSSHKDKSRISRTWPLGWHLDHTHISDAYFPYDPAHGIFGFFRIFYDQYYDTWLRVDTRFGLDTGCHGPIKVPAKVYVTDLLGMPGFLIYTTDPDAVFNVYRWPEKGLMTEIDMVTMEVTTERKVVYVNNGWDGELYHRILIIITSPHPERDFYISIFGFPDD